MKSLETRMLISQKKNEELNERKLKLEYIGRTVPYGYKNIKRTLIIDNKTSYIVYLIFDLYDKGLSITEIADYLNDRGFTSPTYYKSSDLFMDDTNNNNEKQWHRETIRKILLNKVYNGYYKYSNEKTHKEIIDDALFVSVQKKLNSKAQGLIIKKGNENIFSNKVFCAECGSKFTIYKGYTKSGVIIYLRCSCFDKRGIHKINCSNLNVIKYDTLYDIVSMFLEKNVYSNISLVDLATKYEQLLKNEDINIHRQYLKKEKSLLKRRILKLEKTNIIGNDLIAKLKNDKNKILLKLYKARLDEIEIILKNIYSFARLKKVSEKDIYLDKFVVENFIEKIIISPLENNQRKISIKLK